MPQNNKMVWLTIIGFFVASIASGVMANSVRVPFIMISLFIIMFAGVFGEKALIKVGGWATALLVVLTLLAAIPHHLSYLWQAAICWLVAALIGVFISHRRPDYVSGHETDLIYTFVSQDDAFSIMFPKKPKVVEKSQTRHYVFNDGKSAGLGVSVRDVVPWASTKTQKDITAELKIWVGETAGADDMTPVAKPDFKSVRIDGSPAVVTIQRNNTQNTTRYDAVTIKDRKLYDIALNSTVENIELFKNFVDSFKFVG